MLTELSLRDSELRYRRLFETAQDGILILDAKTGMIEDVNPYLIKMLGYSREEFVEKKLWEVGAFKDIEASKDAFEALQENEYIRYEDLPLKAKDGRLIQVEFVSNVYLAGREKIIQCNIRDITEHTRIMLALKENEKKYHDLINQSPDGYFVIELSGNILTANKAMCKELEFSEEEFLALNIWDIIPGQYLDEYRKKLTRVLQGESLKEATEYAVHGKNGETHYVEVLSAPRYSGKNIVGFQGIARDVTARKRAEEALQESETRHRRLIEHLPTVVYTNALGDASSTLYVSPQIQTLLGYTPQEWMADPKLWSKTLHPDDRQHVLRRAAHTDASKEPFEMEYRMIARDGRLVWVHDQIVLVKDLEGQPQFWQGIMLDITERKRAQNALYESEERFSQVWVTTSDAMALSDPEGIMLAANPAYLNLYGYMPEQLIGRSFAIIFPEENREQVVEQYKIVFASQVNPPIFESMIRRSDGTQCIVETSVTFLSVAGQRTAMLSTIRDITVGREAEDKVRSAGEFLQSVQDALSSHITILDHEGNIVQVNSAWRDFGAQNRLGHSNHCIGLNYLEVCDSAKGLQAEGAALVAQAIRDVRSGVKGETGVVEYPCHAPNEQRWFVARITSFENNDRKWIVVAHENITGRKGAEARIQRQLEHLTALSSVDRVIAANVDLKLSLSEILTHVTMELGIDAADVLMLNPNSQMLEYGAERGFRTQAIRKVQVRLGDSYAGRAALNRQLVQVQDLSVEPDHVSLNRHLAGEDFACYFGVPLIAKGQVKGVLEVFHRAALEPDAEWLDFLYTLAGQAAIAIENATLFESLQRSNSELAQAYDATIEGWSRALDLRDKETEGHSQRVTDITVRLARAFGLSEAELAQVRWGALLHDIGKMGVPDSILLKPGSLTDEEWVAMKKHPTFAYEMLSPIRHLRLALDVPYCHHEKWDGTGYPRGLKGVQIPLVARIFAVVDVWDALHSDRPYRAAWKEERVVEHIRALAGTYFDPQVVDVFMQMPK